MNVNQAMADDRYTKEVKVAKYSRTMNPISMVGYDRVKAGQMIRAAFPDLDKAGHAAAARGFRAEATAIRAKWEKLSSDLWKQDVGREYSLLQDGNRFYGYGGGPLLKQASNDRIRALYDTMKFAEDAAIAHEHAGKNMRNAKGESMTMRAALRLCEAKRDTLSVSEITKTGGKVTFMDDETLDSVSEIYVPSGPHAGVYFKTSRSGTDSRTGEPSRKFEMAGALWVNASGKVTFD